MDKTALLVIDMQADLFQKGKPVFNADQLIQNINQLIDVFHRENLPVLIIRHTNGSTMAEGTPGWQLIPELHAAEGDLVLNKKVSNSFKEGAILTAIKSLGVSAVLVTGLVTHGCVKAACEGALELGYAVTLAADGHSSYNTDAAALIEQWNNKLRDAGVDVVETDEIARRIRVEE